MLSKCANPKCNASFQYLSEGKVYELRYSQQPIVPSLTVNAKLTTTSKKMPQRLERFWLCAECSTTMTLGVDRAQNIVIVPLKPHVRHAIAS